MSNILNKASLLLNPAGSSIAYKEDKIFSVLPTDGSGDFTFTGGDGGTRVNQDGYIERTPHNLLPLSNSGGFTNVRGARGSAASRYNIDGYLYSFVTGNPNINNNTLNPDGISNIYTFSFYIDSTGVSAGTVQLNFSANGGADNGLTCTFTYSTGTWGTITEDTTYIEAGSSSVGQEYIGNGVWRLWGTMTIKPTVNTVFPIIYYNNNTNIWIGGVQLNVGYVRPYQPTTDRLNYPRITYQNGRGALLSEPQRTNSVAYSSDFANAYWTKTNASIVSNVGVAPDGTTTADRLVPDTSLATRHHVYKTLQPISDNCYSIFAKADGFNWLLLSSHRTSAVKARGTFFDLENGVIGEKGNGQTAWMEDYGNGWWKCSIDAGLSPSSIYTAFCCEADDDADIAAPNGTDGIQIWGAENQNGLYPTSYIPTTSATVTRPGETTRNTSASSVIGPSEGTLYFEITPQFFRVADYQTLFLLYNSGGLASQYIHLFKDINTKNLRLFVTNGGTQCDIPYTMSDNVRYKVAAAYKANDFALYVNGVLAGSDASGTVPSNNKNVIETFYDSFNSNAQLTGNLAALFTSRLSNTQLEELTTINSGSGGNISYYGPYTTHTFTSSGTFTPSFSGEVEVLIVSGGGGGGGAEGNPNGGGGGGGGAGGVVYYKSYPVTSGTNYSVVVGSGGSGGTNDQNNATNGNDSSFGILGALGGGSGGPDQNASPRPGGSGGGAGGDTGEAGAPSIREGQGNKGGDDLSSSRAGGGGGGAGTPGENSTDTGGTMEGTAGGDGKSFNITGRDIYYAGGGGGGGSHNFSGVIPNSGLGGLGGGGNSVGLIGGSLTPNTSGVPNTGGGGGGGANATSAGNGGSGIVIVRYLT